MHWISIIRQANFVYLLDFVAFMDFVDSDFRWTDVTNMVYVWQLKLRLKKDGRMKLDLSICGRSSILAFGVRRRDI